eukprot:11184070-Lingulodinium_polyedra.AAC.1
MVASACWRRAECGRGGARARDAAAPAAGGRLPRQRDCAPGDPQGWRPHAFGPPGSALFRCR